MLNQFFGQWFPGGQQPAPQATVGLSHISLEYSEADLANATEFFSGGRKLGSGTYGAVYRGSLKDGSEVAVKVIEVEENQADGGFADEVRVLSKFRHPNLVTLMGWGRSWGKRFLVYELLAGGDVSHRLQKCKPPVSANSVLFPAKERVQVLQDAATGLSHMHNSTPKAFHRDIKSANILLDRNGTAKMADFGLSGIAKQKGMLHMTCQNISGTPGYACPLYIRSGIVTEKTEVFAFGMVMLEVLMNVQPALMGQNGIVYPIFQAVMPQAPGAKERALKHLDVGADWPGALADSLATLALSCVNMEDSQRPDFAEIVRHLKGCTESSGPGAIPPTRPQMGVRASGGSSSAVVAADATKPQMGGPSQAAPPQAGNGYVDATRPQLGRNGTWVGGASSSKAVPGPTPPAADVTRPQMGLPNGLASGGMQRSNSMRLPGPPASQGGSTPMSGPGSQRRSMTPPPSTGRGAGPGGAPAPPPQPPPPPAPSGPNALRRFMDIVKGLWEEEPEKGGTELVEVVLECIFAGSLDVSRMPLKHKCVALRLDQAPWLIGRMQQQQLFTRLVPNETLRNNISRVHFELSWEPPAVFMKKMTPNTLLVNGVPAPASRIPLGHGSHIGLCQAGAHAPFLAFCLMMRDAAAVSAQGPTPQPTVPDVPMPQMPVGALPATQQATSPPPPLQQQQPLTPSRRDLQQQQQQQAAMPQQAPPVWAFTGPPLPLTLVCTFSRACEMASVPSPTKTIGFQRDIRFLLGRQHQPGFFEGLLRGEERFLSFISRSHLEFNPAPGQPGAFDVANLSSNPVMVSQSLTTGRQEKLKKNDRAVVRPPMSIDFIAAADPTSAAPVVFLRLGFDEAAAEAGGATPRSQGATAQSTANPASGRSASRPQPNPSLDQSTYDIARHLPASVKEVPVFPEQQGLSGQRHGASTPRTAASPAPAPALAEPPTRPQLHECHGAVSAAAAGPGGSLTGKSFSLELRGSAVREDLPKVRRTVESCDGIVTIGRTHQQQLLKEVLLDGVAQFMSREHFQIKLGPDGYMLTAMGSNPIWRVHRGLSMEVQTGQAPSRLEPGDKVQLFTGATDGTPDGPGSLGTFFWVLSGPKVEADMLTDDTVTFHQARQAATSLAGKRDSASSLSSSNRPRTPTHADTSTPRGGGARGGGGGGALRVPIEGFSLDHESPRHQEAPAYRGPSYDEADDAFAKSSFSFR